MIAEDGPAPASSLQWIRSSKLYAEDRSRPVKRCDVVETLESLMSAQPFGDAAGQLSVVFLWRSWYFALRLFSVTACAVQVRRAPPTMPRPPNPTGADSDRVVAVVERPAPERTALL